MVALVVRSASPAGIRAPYPLASGIEPLSKQQPQFDEIERFHARFIDHAGMGFDSLRVFAQYMARQFGHDPNQILLAWNRGCPYRR